MLDFLNKLQNINLVFAAFVMLLAAFLFTRDANIFTLMNLSLGGVIGLAQKNYKSQSIDVDKIENAEISAENPK